MIQVSGFFDTSIAILKASDGKKVVLLEDVTIRYIDLPGSVKSFVKEKDGDYTIVLNARLNRETQQEACKHEMEHLDNEDFQKADVQKIEKTAHPAATGWTARQ